MRTRSGYTDVEIRSACRDLGFEKLPIDFIISNNNSDKGLIELAIENVMELHQVWKAKQAALAALAEITGDAE